MATKLKDLCVVVGTTGEDGKKKYENIGALWQGDQGQFLTLKRTFNPAGVPCDQTKDSIFVSLFDPRQHGERRGTPAQPQQPQQRQSQPPRRTTDGNGVPF